MKSNVGTNKMEISFSDKDNGTKKMNLHFTFSVREISEVNDGDQTLKIPMYLAIEWEASNFQKIN